MKVVSPARCEDRLVLRTQTLANAVTAMGTKSFGRACFSVFEEFFNVDHWSLYRYQNADTVRCVATASRKHEAAAGKNVDLFLTRCFRVDPSLLAYRERHSQRPCLINMNVADIFDRQYRHCFELTRVRERLSFFQMDGPDLLQLSIFRAALDRSFSETELSIFSTVAALVIATGMKHESLWAAASLSPRGLELGALEKRFESLGRKLSRRECEVCARAVIGRNIEETAKDLAIKKTSVITYRQRAYQKLGIARQGDLVGLVCEASLSQTTAAQRRVIQ